MTIYFGLAFIIFLFSIYDISIERNAISSNRVLGWSLYYQIAFVLIVLGGFRWYTGSDWQPYYNYFNNNKTWADYSSRRFEPLFAFLNFIVHKFSSSYTVYLFVLSLLVISIKAFTIRKIALYPALSFYLFFCTNIGDILPVRQGLAGSILLASIYFIHKKDKKKFLILLVVATLIHYSSLLWIFSYYIYHKKINRLYIAFLIVLSICIGFIGNVLYPVIIRAIFSPFNSISAVSNIISYSLRVDETTFSYLRAVISIIKRLLFIPFFLIMKKQLDNADKYMPGILNLYFFGNIVYLFFTLSATTFQRMTTPYVFTEILILPVFLKIIKKKELKYMFLYGILIYGLFKLYSAIQPFTDFIVPYYTIFNFEYRQMY